MTPKLCECGCGKQAPISPVTWRKWGYVKGEPRRFIRGHANKGIVGVNSKSWKGGKGLQSDGYCTVSILSNDGKYKNRKMEHVLIAEKALGRTLPPKAVVHHANGIRNDNRNENLVICEDRAYHRLLHQRIRTVQAGYPPHWRKCSFCKTYSAPENLLLYSNNPAHRECKLKYNRENRKRRKLNANLVAND